MFASIFIFILLLPAACLPLALDIFFSSSELGEMGVCLKKSDDLHAMSLYEYELVCIPLNSNSCENAGFLWGSAKDYKFVSKLSIWPAQDSPTGRGVFRIEDLS
jgi:hypothetical protein